MAWERKAWRGDCMLSVPRNARLGDLCAFGGRLHSLRRGYRISQGHSFSYTKNKIENKKGYGHEGDIPIRTKQQKISFKKKGRVYQQVQKYLCPRRSPLQI